MNKSKFKQLLFIKSYPAFLFGNFFTIKKDKAILTNCFDNMVLLAVFFDYIFIIALCYFYTILFSKKLLHFGFKIAAAQQPHFFISFRQKPDSKWCWLNAFFRCSSLLTIFCLCSFNTLAATCSKSRFFLLRFRIQILQRVFLVSY